MKFEVKYKYIGDDLTIYYVQFNSVYELYGGLSVLCDSAIDKVDVLDVYKINKYNNPIE